MKYMKYSHNIHAILNWKIYACGKKYIYLKHTSINGKLGMQVDAWGGRLKWALPHPHPTPTLYPFWWHQRTRGHFQLVKIPSTNIVELVVKREADIDTTIILIYISSISCRNRSDAYFSVGICHRLTIKCLNPLNCWIILIQFQLRLRSCPGRTHSPWYSQFKSASAGIILILWGIPRV